jgi:hypothetical protein
MKGVVQEYTRNGFESTVGRRKEQRYAHLFIQREQLLQHFE